MISVSLQKSLTTLKMEISLLSSAFVNFYIELHMVILWVKFTTIQIVKSSLYCHLQQKCFNVTRIFRKKGNLLVVQFYIRFPYTTLRNSDLCDIVIIWFIPAHVNILPFLIKERARIRQVIGEKNTSSIHIHKNEEFVRFDPKMNICNTTTIANSMSLW